MPGDQTISEETLKKYFKKEGQDVKIIYLKLLNSGYISRFRDIWGLPSTGFSNWNNYYKWRGAFLNKRANNFFVSEEYKAMGDEMKRKKQQWADDKIPYSEIDAYGLKIQRANPVWKFDDDIETVMTILRIPERYKAFIEGALILKIPPDYFMISKHLPKPFLHTDPNTGRRKLLIETCGDTKLEDFRSPVFIHHFKKLQPKVYDYGTIKKLGVPNFDIWKQLSDWRDEGKPYSEIRELSNNQLGYCIKHDEDVKTYVKRYKRSVGGTRKKKV